MFAIVAIDISKFPLRMNEQLLKISAPQSESSFETLNKPYKRWPPSFYV